MITRRTTLPGPINHPAYSTWTEAENVLIDSVDADLVHLTDPIEKASVRVRRQGGRALRRLFGNETGIPPFGRSAAPLRSLSGRYDFAVFMAYSTWDLPLLERLGNIRNHTDTVIVWFVETWPSVYADGRIRGEPFHTVDHIFVGMDAAAEPLSAAIGRPVDYLPIAADVLRFSPSEPHGNRPIDLIGLGRRRPDQHQMMTRWAEDSDRLYLYDTTRVGKPVDIESHRRAIGRWYSQAKLATCNYAKSGETQLIGDLRIIPGRLTEGLAAGARLVGAAPSEESQRALFDRTVVDQTPEDPRAIPAFLDHAIESWTSQDAAAQVRLALTGHDWAHRWKEMLNRLALPVPHGIQDRVDSLAVRADKFL